MSETVPPDPSRKPQRTGDASRFAEPRRLDPRGIAVEALLGLRKGLGTYGVAAAVAVLTSRGALVVLVVSVVLVAIGGSALLRWWRRTYCILDGDLVLAGGVLARTTTAVPLERVQAVSIEQQLAQRLFGLVRVRIDTAGSGADEIDLTAVSRPDAEALRRAIIAGRGTGPAADPDRDPHEVGADAAAGQPEPGGPTPWRSVLSRSVNELVVVGVTRNPLRIAAAVAGSLVAFGDDVFGRTDLDERATGLLPGGVLGVVTVVTLVAALLVVAGSTAAVVRYFGLTLEVDAEADPTFRARYGWLDRRERTVTNRRIQMILAASSPTERLVNRRTVQLRPVGERAETAGDGGSASLPGTTAAELDEIVALHLGRPMIEPDRPIDRAIVLRRTQWLGVAPAVAAGLVALVVLASGGPALWGLVPLGAVLWVAVVRWHAVALWSSWRWHVGAGLVCARSGALWRHLRIAQVHKLQAVVLSTDWFERRHGLASVVLTTGAGRLRLPYLDEPVARDVRDELLAAAEASPLAWM